jgi:hypothetical protein
MRFLYQKEQKSIRMYSRCSGHWISVSQGALYAFPLRGGGSGAPFFVESFTSGLKAEAFSMLPYALGLVTAT